MLVLLISGVLVIDLRCFFVYAITDILTFRVLRLF